jgi:hypothetical protein
MLQCLERHLQDRPIKSFFAAEMIIDGGLVDVSPGDDPADARAIIAVLGKNRGCRLDDLVARELGRTRGHSRFPISNDRFTGMVSGRTAPNQ